MDWRHLYQISDGTIASRMVQWRACVAKPSSANIREGATPHANIAAERATMFPVYLELEARSRCLYFWELLQERSEQAASAKSAVLTAG